MNVVMPVKNERGNAGVHPRKIPWNMWIFTLFTLFTVGCLLLTGCGENRSGKITENSSLSEFLKGKRLGVMTGTTMDALAIKEFSDSAIVYGNNINDLALMLKAGKLDAFLMTEPESRMLLPKNPELVREGPRYADDDYAFMFARNEAALCEEFSREIRRIKKGGILDKLQKKWFAVGTTAKEMPSPAVASPRGELKYAVYPHSEPFCYLRDGKVVGYDVEIAEMVAAKLGYRLKPVILDWGGYLASVMSGKVRMGIGCTAVTDERKQNVLFSEPDYRSGIVVIIRKIDQTRLAEHRDVSRKGTAANAMIRLNVPGKKIGVPQGAAAMTVGEKLFDKAKILYFSSLADGYAAVKYKKIDAFLFDRHSMNYATVVNPELKLIPEDLAEEHIVIGLPKKHHELRNKVNAFIREYRANGVYQDMHKRWLDSPTHVMPDIPAPSAPTVKLKIATEGLNEPMNYFGKDGKVTGFDVEFIKRLAVFLNAEIEIETMTYPALIAATETGRIDMMVSNLNATPERAKSMLMTEDYVDSAIAAMVHADFIEEGAPEKDGIRSLADLKGKKAASITGSGFQVLTDPLQSGIQHVFFNDIHTCVAALRTGKVDAVLLDKPMTQMFASRFSTDTRFVCVYAKDYYGFAFRKGSPLTEQASKVIRELKKSGEMEKFAEKWLGGGDAEIAVWTHKKDFDGSAGILRYASDPTQEPMCYTDKNGNPCGLDIEVMRRVAYELNMKFQFISMNFGSLIEALLAEKADAAGGSMSITEERKKRVDFAECYYEGGLSILARKKAGKSAGITDLSQLNGKRVGILSGTTLDVVIKQKLPQAIPTYFNGFTDLPIALNAGKISAFLIEMPQFAAVKKQYPGMTMLSQQLSHDEYAFVFSKRNKNLCDEFSRQIRNMKSDGTLKKLEAQWFSSDSSVQTVPFPTVALPKGKLRFAIAPQMEPFAFLREGKPVGYDLDVARMAAARMGYIAEPVILDFSAILEAVNAGKVDFGASCITITEERKRKMLFSEPDYRGGIVAVVMSEQTAKPETSSFLNSFKESFERTFLVENRWKLILDGLKITVIITVLAAILGTLLAFPVCFLRRSKRRIPKWIGGLYVSLLQGTPILVILMLLYYVVFAKCDIDAVIVAVIGFGLNFAAYAGEMLRTGIDAVPAGQIEAAKALSLTRFQTFRKVVFPQAARQILPVYRGEFINMLKTTSVVGYIAIQDLTKMSDIIRSRTYEAFFPLIATALIYFAAAWLLASVLSYFEYRLTPGRRVRATKGGASK